MRRLWYNAKVTSMDSAMHVYQAIGTDGNGIVFLGSDADALKQPWDEKEDLNGAMLLPGFNDTHMHMLYYATFSRNVMLFGADSINNVVAMLRERIEKEHPACVIGMGWNQEIMQEGRLLTKADLDRVSTEIPVFAVRACIHIAACNSVALQAIKKLELSDEVRVGIDYETGILRESAVGIYCMMVPPTPDEEIEKLIDDTQKKLNADGITAIHSDDLTSVPGVDGKTLLNIFKKMDDEGRLTVRIFEQSQGYGDEFKDVLAMREATREPERLFRVYTRKLLLDGSLGAKSAEMIDGYIDDPTNHGIANFSVDELYKLISEANANRMDVAVHAIGDLALKQLCDIFERVLGEDPWPEHRHGVVHAQITNPKLLERMKKLGLQAYIQPIFIDADMEIVNERIGKERAGMCYQWKTMRDMGIPSSGGSDCPVEPFNILDNMRSAITRKNRKGTHVYLPDQALSTEEAIRLFTSDAAWAARDEERRGTLELGKLADMSIVDKDLFNIDPDTFTSVRVLQTVVNGITVYRS